MVLWFSLPAYSLLWCIFVWTEEEVVRSLGVSFLCLQMALGRSRAHNPMRVSIMLYHTAEAAVRQGNIWDEAQSHPCCQRCCGSGQLAGVCCLLGSPLPKTSDFSCCQGHCDLTYFLFLLLFQVNRSHVIPALWKNKWFPRAALSTCFCFKITIITSTNIETCHIDIVSIFNWSLFNLLWFLFSLGIGLCIMATN